ncbi:MAG: ribonuclease Z [Actinobacteria bacterium]|nr:ribonuclease Z [Actinomycetota bacterium]
MPATLRPDGQPHELVRGCERPREILSRSSVYDDPLPPDERRREHRVRVQSQITRTVGEHLLSEVVGEQRGDDECADGQNGRGGEYEGPEQGQRPRQAGRAICPRRHAVCIGSENRLFERVESAAVDLDVVFLGTSGSTPTAERALAATLVRRGGDRLLFDCAEGTQRQLLRCDVGLAELEEIFLTHFHADHYLGLPGMLKTYSLRGRALPLTIYGPRGLRELLKALRRIFGRLSYPLEAVELDPGDRLERGGYMLETFAVDHGVAAVGYALVETERPGRFDVEAADRLGVPDGPSRGLLQRGETVTLADGSEVGPEAVLGLPRAGRKLVLTGDTAPAASVVDAAAGADLLVHEATFLADERERARETLHSTAGEAALVARESGVKLLALTHVSTRYFGHQVVEEARELFPDTVVPRDFDVVEIPFPERGQPQLIRSGARARRAAAASTDR